MLQKESSGSVKFISINKQKLLPKLKKIASIIKRKNPEVIDVRLFGSIAKNEDIGTSDIDIVIILNNSEENLFQRILKYKKYLDLPIPVDVLVYTEDEIEKMIKEKNFFIKTILEESRSLFQN